MLVLSDLHWRCDTPSWRKEPDYREVLRHKLGTLLDTREAVVVAGDVFHCAADFAAVYDLYSFLLEKGAVIYAPRGQHDMLLHNASLSATGYNMLVKAGMLIPLGSKPRQIEAWRVCGMGWGEEVPSVNADALIAHVPVSVAGATYPGATSADAFRSLAASFNMVFTGDNHRRFTIPSLYNAGCFHRMTIDLEHQAPAAWHVTADGVSLYEVPCPGPVVNTAYVEARKNGATAAVAGLEFAMALAEARQQGGGDVFLSALKGAESSVDGGAKVLLQALIKLCEEMHT